MDRIARRDLLSRVAAIGSVAGVGALAGCGAGGNSDRTTFGVPDRTASPTAPEVEVSETDRTTTDPADVVEFGPVDAPDPGPAAFRGWLPAPQEFVDPGETERDANDEAYRVLHLDLDGISGRGGAVPPGLTDSARFLRRTSLDHFGVDGYSRLIRMGPTRTLAVEASFDRSAVAETLLGTGYADAGRHRGYRLFDRTDDPRAVALGEGDLVFADVGTEETSPADLVRSVVDARTGAAPRFHETVEWFGRISRALGGAPLGALRGGSALRGRGPPLEDLDGLVGHARGFTFDADATYEHTVFGFDRARNRDRRRQALRRYAAQSRLEEARAVEVTVEGALGRLVAAFPDDHYVDRGPGDGDADVTYPQVTWGFDHERTSEEVRVTVTHEAGTELPESTLTVETDVDAPLPKGFSEGDDLIGPGDSVSFGIPRDGTSPPYEVRLVWRAPDDAAAATLGSYRIEAERSGE